MKLQKKIDMEFAAIRAQYPKIRAVCAHTKARSLWQQEAVVREKLRLLQRMRAHAPKGFDEVFERYVELLKDISRKILANYNDQHGTAFQFDEVVRGNFKAFLRSGIMSVLMTGHIPKLFSEAFKRVLPENPKDEYPAARAMRRHFILHLGDTNTGKTHNAIRRLAQGGEGIYLAPLRVLALENFETMNRLNAPCSLMTGEEEILVEGARLTSCTIEKLNLDKRYPVAVIDECQLMADPQRGAAWVRAILGLRCPEIHICGALNAKEQLQRMILECGDSFEFHRYTRAVPLMIDWKTVEVPKVQPGDALIAFSKKRVIALCEYLESRKIPAAVIYGDLPPEVRKMQYTAFLRGEKRVLVATDAIGMGVNLPIRRIVFTELTKFDGQQVRPLTSQEVKQIAGRAGRLGIYDVGYVASMADGQSYLQAQLEEEDQPIAQAVVGPSEALLSIRFLRLREKLALWSAREEHSPHYRKMDVRDQLVVLDAITNYRLPEEIQWRLMMLPFDVHSQARMEQFLTYMEAHLVRHEKALPRPELARQDLSELEGYYQAINLYYAFSRAFSLPFDEQWVVRARKSVCEKINSVLNGHKR